MNIVKITNSVLFFLMCLLVIFPTKNEAAENEGITKLPDFYDVVLGESFPSARTNEIIKNNSPLPVWTTRIPLPSNSKIKIVKDYRVNIDKESGLVSWKGFEKAYPSTSECERAANTIIKEVIAIYGFKESNNALTKLESSVGDIKAQIFCLIDPAGYDFSTLTVNLRSEKLTNAQLEKMGR